MQMQKSQMQEWKAQKPWQGTKCNVQRSESGIDEFRAMNPCNMQTSESEIWWI